MRLNFGAVYFSMTKLALYKLCAVLGSHIISVSKSASNCMILEHVTTDAFLQIRSTKYQRAVKKLYKKAYCHQLNIFVVVKEKGGGGGVEKWEFS